MPAAIIVEVVAPDDQTSAKLPFSAAQAVDEVLVIDAGPRTVRWFINTGWGFDEGDASVLTGVTSAEIAAGIRLPE